MTRREELLALADDPLILEIDEVLLSWRCFKSCIWRFITFRNPLTAAAIRTLAEQEGE